MHGGMHGGRRGGRGNAEAGEAGAEAGAEAPFFSALLRGGAIRTMASRLQGLQGEWRGMQSYHHDHESADAKESRDNATYSK